MARSLAFVGSVALVLISHSHANDREALWEGGILQLGDRYFVGFDGDRTTWFHFELDGTLRYGHSAGSFANGTWWIMNSNVHFEMNKGYRGFRGSIQGDTITGHSWNRAGARWSTRVLARPKNQINFQNP